MNAMTTDNLKTLACTAAALAVTTLFSWTFVDSTAALRWAVSEGIASAALVGSAQDHAGAGQSASAVLVD